jgi:hypothetical protein
VLGVRAVNFLQEHEIGIEGAQALTQVVYRQPPVTEWKTLVDVVGCDAYGVHVRVECVIRDW